MKKVEPTTAAVIICGLACVTIVLTLGPADSREQLIALIGGVSTVLAGILPKLVGNTSDK